MIQRVLEVSQLNRYVKSLLESDRVLSGLMIRGEISNFTRHYKSGHLYFTLKDAQAAIKAVMFRSSAQGLRFAPDNGMSVIVSGYVSLYEQGGSYQLYVTDMQPDGLGALYLAFEQRKARLEGEGLFDSARKRPLPRFPATIGIVTSAGAAALQDILNILSRRWPCARVVLAQAQVQGDGAEKTLIAALRDLNERAKCDVIIIGRGGGSIEDLWAFNDEKLAREIAASPTPVISAVGHETDFTIADFAADVRAPTPSAAAELAAPDLGEVRQWLDNLSHNCLNLLRRRLQMQEYRLRTAKAGIQAPELLLKACEQKLNLYRQTLPLSLNRRIEHEASRLNAVYKTIPMQTKRSVELAQTRLSGIAVNIHGGMEHILDETERRLHHLASLAQERSPIKRLERGYSHTSVGGTTLVSVEQARPGQIIKTTLQDGFLLSEVREIEKKRTK